MRIAPRSLGLVLADAMNTMARVWKPLLSSALIVFVPIGILTLLVFGVTDATAFLDAVFNDPDYISSLSGDQVRRLAAPFVRAALVAIGLQLLGVLFVYATAARLVALDTAGFSTTGPDVRRQVGGRYLTLLLVGGMALILVATAAGLVYVFRSLPMSLMDETDSISALLGWLGYMLLAAPAVWLGVSSSMAVPAAIVAQLGPLRAVQESLRLVRRRWWPTFGFLLLVGLLGFLAVQLIQLVAIPLVFVRDLGPGITGASMLGIATQGVIIAAGGVMLSVWYVDLRSRTEALEAEDLS